MAHEMIEEGKLASEKQKNIQAAAEFWGILGRHAKNSWFPKPSCRPQRPSPDDDRGGCSRVRVFFKTTSASPLREPGEPKKKKEIRR
jgi:hypothetical protein